MKIFLVRHGEAENSENPPLTKKGVQQSKELAMNLKNLDFERVFCSELLRARQTCDEFIEISGRVVEYSDELNEIYRVIVGGPKKEDASENREILDKNRADNFYNKLLDLNEDVIIFCHGNIIRYFLARFLNKHPKEMWHVEIPNASINVLDFNRHS